MRRSNAEEAWEELANKTHRWNTAAQGSTKGKSEGRSPGCLCAESAGVEAVCVAHLSVCATLTSRVTSVRSFRFLGGGSGRGTRVLPGYPQLFLRLLEGKDLPWIGQRLVVEVDSWLKKVVETETPLRGL